jgi:hypothetical protein
VARVVEEADLDFRHFRCCGDKDLYPFGCPRCGRPMVFCYECDRLYGDLTDLESTKYADSVNHLDTLSPIFNCPGCGYAFEYFFIRDKLHKVPFEQWAGAGFGHLLNSSGQAYPTSDTSSDRRSDLDTARSTRRRA